jgi:hypothetical protein
MVLPFEARERIIVVGVGCVVAAVHVAPPSVDRNTTAALNAPLIPARSVPPPAASAQHDA